MMKMKKNNRYLAVIIGCALFNTALNIPFNCSGIVFAAIIQEKMGFTMAGASLFWTIRALSNGLMAPLVTRLYLKTDSGKYLIFLGLMSVLCYAPMVIYRHSALWILSAAALGVCNAGQILALASIINKWFPKGSGTLLGICNALSGLMTAILSPLLSKAIGAVGWRSTLLTLILICFACVLFCAVLLIPNSPESIGLRPYETEKPAKKEKSSQSSEKDRVWTDKKWLIYALIAIIGLHSITINSMNNYMATYATSLGYALSLGALLTSIASVANILIQLIGGFLCDRIGSWKVAVLVYGVIAAAVSVMLFLNSSVSGLVIGAAGIGICFFPFATLLPKLAQASFGEQYEVAFGKINMIVNLTGTASIYLMGLLCNLNNGFGMAFRVVIVLCMISIFASGFVYFLKQKNKDRKL